MSMAMRRGPRPLTWRNPDQGLSHNATGGFAGWSGEQPGDCHLSLQVSNSSPLKHHGVVTKTPRRGSGSI
jgi:hypothetical protein